VNVRGGATRETDQAPPPAAQQRPEVPAFRSRVTLVPLDVRVVDAQGNPVTDLTEKDFTVVEDGARQRIAHFLPHGLTPQPASAATPPPALRQKPAHTIPPLPACCPTASDAWTRGGVKPR
jgi:hypothetical protein